MCVPGLREKESASFAIKKYTASERVDIIFVSCVSLVNKKVDVLTEQHLVVHCRSDKVGHLAPSFSIS